MSSKRQRDLNDFSSSVDSRPASAYRGASASSSAAVFSHGSIEDMGGRGDADGIEYNGPAADMVANHIGELNKALMKWVSSQLESNPKASLVDGIQEAIRSFVMLSQKHLQPYPAGELLTFGDGGCGQAGHGMEETSDLEVRYPRIVSGLFGKKVVNVACGGLHNAVCTQDGRVYTWGCSDDGSLGRGGFEGTPMLVSGEKDSMLQHKFVAVGCGDGQTIALSSIGEVWGWGCYKDKDSKQWFDVPSGLTGKEALKSLKRKQTEPMIISFFAQKKGVTPSASASGSPVVDITCGASFNLARCNDGAVYSWGTAECGELARETAEMKIPDPQGEPGDEMYDLPTILRDYITPQRMIVSPADTDKDPLHVSSNNEIHHVHAFGCGSFHTMVVAGDRVYACGLNQYGQLGMGDTENRTFLTEIRSMRGAGVVSVKGGQHHSLALTSAGQLLSFGRGDSGQLGVPLVSEHVGGFVEVPIAPGTKVINAGESNAALDALAKEHFVAIACGSNHCLALARSDTQSSSAVPAQCTLYSWGYGDMLALGHGKEKDEVSPRRISTWGKKDPNSNPDPDAVDFKYSLVQNIMSIDAGGQHSAVVATVR